MKMEKGKLKTKIFASFTTLALMFGAVSCEQLQSTLSSEQSADMLEETGSAVINGSTWYYDGISTTDFSNTTGATLAISFTKKVEMAGTRTINDDGTYTYDYELSGSITANYTSTSGQSSTVSYKVSEGNIILDSTSDPFTTISAGSLSADGKTFRLDMTPVCALLDAETTSGNTIDSLEIKLTGFVCAEGEQKGRSLAALSQKISVKPFYDDATITEGVLFSTASSTAGKYVTIPTNGSVSLASGAGFEFSSSDSDASGLTASDFTLEASDEGITLLCNKDLKDKEFTGTFTISGFVPELNASSYTRTFTVNFTPQYVTLDGSLDEEAWTVDSVSATDSYADPAGYDLTKISVTNDSANLYIAVEGDFAFNAGDRIVVMIDNASATATGKSSSDGDYNTYYGPATNATFSSVDFFLSHILATPEMQDYYWISSSGRTDVSTSAKTSSASVIEYKIPFSSIANAAAGNTLKIFVTTTSYAWTTINEMTLQDCIPQAAATVTDGGQTLAVDFANAFSYTVKATD
ncbi:MAG: hypothetical protein IJ558_01645 [Treponema sp.]|nr:hypothetical protein [Treponema sp.]